MRPVYDKLTLYITNEAFTFIPDHGRDSLTITRATGQVAFEQPAAQIPRTARRHPKTVHAIYGIISLSQSEYLIIATGRTLYPAPLLGHKVYRLHDFELIPINPLMSPDLTNNNQVHPVEAHLQALVKSHLSNGVFWASYTCDITTRLQAQWETREQRAHSALYEVADDRFFWNKFPASKLIESGANVGSYVLPILYGTVSIHEIPLSSLPRKSYLALISRRSRYRAGTRYFRRGIDSEGHVANFVESEQILLAKNEQEGGIPGSPFIGAHDFDDGWRDPFSDPTYAKLSFVQIRGSIPLFWAEINTLRYKPDLVVMQLEETMGVLREHLDEQLKLYSPHTDGSPTGSLDLINLVNHKGHEGPIKEAYDKAMAEVSATLPNVRYEYFDFHNECKNMRWDRISVLIDRIKDDIERVGFFHIPPSKSPVPERLQNGVLRTNCMDNLDRTNVVQAALAKYVLQKQLYNIGGLVKEEGVDDNEALSAVFRNMWADHGDQIARAYGGSGALKSDFTRTNKRTRKGALEDGVKSVLRYVKNNFLDGPRQDAFDLMTGVYVPRQNPSSAMFLVTDRRDVVTRSMPAVAGFSFFMICAGLTLPRTSDYSLLYYFLLWFTWFLVAMTFIFVHGICYVSWPRLVSVKDTVFYDGPGFRKYWHGMGLDTKKAKSGVNSGLEKAALLKSKPMIMMEKWAGGGNDGDKRVD
ncbi:SacI homology domain-containing protein [Schizophyllum commune]